MQVKTIIWRFSILKLVVVRHGQSQCNLIKRWSGWSDSQLTPKGQANAVECANIIKQQGLQFDLAYCSYLSRTINTLHIILQQLHSLHLPVRKRWQLNEKFYGALQDMDKLTVVDQYGQKMVAQWRRSYHIAPPKVSLQDHRHPINDPKYKHVDPSLLPSTEHLGDVLARVKALYDSQIKKELENKKRLLVVCHGSVVRVLTNILLGFDYAQSSKFNLPNATPLVIDLDKSLKGVRWKLLGDPTVIASKMSKLENELKH